MSGKTTSPGLALPVLAPLLSAAVFAGALAFHADAVRDTRERTAANQKKCANIRALDGEFKEFLEEDVAAGRLLEQARAARPFDATAWLVASSKAAGLPVPTVTVRTPSEELSGHSFTEATAVWADADPQAFGALVAKAEAREPPLRLRSAELKARYGGKAAITAVFSTLQ